MLHAALAELEHMLAAEVGQQLAALESRMRQQLGDADDPLLVSVRSGARFSMPGMMETVLDIGLNDASVRLAGQSGDERSRWTRIGGCCRCSAARCSASTPRRLPRCSTTTSRPATMSRTSTSATMTSASSGRAPPRLPNTHQLLESPTAQVSASPRDLASGRHGVCGDYLQNAQGEDGVAGIRNTVPLTDLAAMDQASYDALLTIMATLEKHYRDMCDIEFTIE